MIKIYIIFPYPLCISDYYDRDRDYYDRHRDYYGRGYYDSQNYYDDYYGHQSRYDARYARGYYEEMKSYGQGDGQPSGQEYNRYVPTHLQGGMGDIWVDGA